MKRRLLLVMAIMMCAAPAGAGIKEGGFSVTAGGAAYLSDGSQHLKLGPGGAVRLGYDFTERWGVEGAFNFILSESTKRKSQWTERDIFRIDGLYHFMPESKIVPYLSAGFGWMYIDNAPVRTNLLLNVGVGAKYFLTDSLALRADIREIGVFDKGHQLNTEAMLGVTWYFAQWKPKVVTVQQPPPASRVVVLGPTPVPEGPRTSWQAETTVAPEGKVLVSGMRINGNALEIIATGPISDYKVFTLSQSSRLVIDISNAVSGFAADKIAIGKLGIAAVRFGDNPDYLRIILDAENTELLPYRIDETDKGLLIVMMTADQVK